MFLLIYHWIDILWLGAVFFIVQKRHWWWASGFIVSCMIMMRIQEELLQSIDYNFGILGLSGLSVHARGLIVYGFFYILFFWYAHFSPHTEGVIFMAACLGLFFMAFAVAMIAMLL